MFNAESRTVSSLDPWPSKAWFSRAMVLLSCPVTASCLHFHLSGSCQVCQDKNLKENENVAQDWPNGSKTEVHINQQSTAVDTLVEKQGSRTIIFTSHDGYLSKPFDSLSYQDTNQVYRSGPGGEQESLQDRGGNEQGRPICPGGDLYCIPKANVPRKCTLHLTILHHRRRMVSPSAA
jgi:hypothetical protein